MSMSVYGLIGSLDPIPKRIAMNTCIPSRWTSAQSLDQSTNQAATQILLGAQISWPRSTGAFTSADPFGNVWVKNDQYWRTKLLDHI